MSEYFPNGAKSLKLKEDARSHFKFPIGALIRPAEKKAEEYFLEQFGNQIRKGKILLAVGDVVTKTLISVDLIPDISIIDSNSFECSCLSVAS